MKPLKVEFQAFGPYAGLEAVDFNDLSTKGLFLICGETGSGKTMLLDAITFALYGKSSGHTRDSFESMRCTSADFDATTFVKFIFEAGGETYLFERRLERKRKNLSPSYNLMKKDSDGIFKALLENPREKDLNAKAVELIGLEYDQFRQVIILPQGQFEELLTSSSDDKEKILTNIFGEDKWQKISEKFYAKASDRKEKLSKIRDKIAGSLQEEACDTIAELEEVTNAKKSQLEELDKEYLLAGHEENIEKLQKLSALSKRFEDLSKLLLEKKNLEERLPQRRENESILILARKSDKVRTYITEADKSQKALDSRLTNLEATIKKEAQYKEKCQEDEKSLNGHNEKESSVEANKKRIAVFESKKDDYSTINQVEERIVKKESEISLAIKNQETCEKANGQIEEVIILLRNEWTTLESEYRLLLDAYISGISGNLAKELKEGHPCPVCGSLEHPSPAVLQDDSITKAAVDNKKTLAEAKNKELEAALSKQKELSVELENKKKIVNDLNIELSAIKSEYESKNASLIEGINNLDELEKSIRNLQEENNSFYSKKEELEHNLSKAREDYLAITTRIEEAKAEIEKAKEEASNAKKALDDNLKANDFNSKEEAAIGLLSLEEMDKLQQAISEYDAKVMTNNNQIEEMQKELSGIEEPDKDKVAEQLRFHQECIKEHANKKGALELEFKRLAGKVEMLNKESKGIEAQLKEAEEDFTFAKKLRGDSGTGLQRYVLGIMFSSVVTAANKMLELVHDGRYRMYRSDEKSQGNNKRGLELKVIDKYSDDPEGRFVNTLSGGEKFLASLALSIGMSSIAQKSGINIEALFIDEGFGSLDDNSIVDAMNILNSIQKSNGLVGIISHVQLLEDRIPTKLIVNKEEGRSHITQSIG